MAENPQKAPQPEALTLAEFFEKVPPGSSVSVKNLVTPEPNHYSPGAPNYRFSPPTLQLFCTNEICDGWRVFSPIRDNWFISPRQSNFEFVKYQCRNCARSVKTFAVDIDLLHEGSYDGTIYKLGEKPPFGPPTPAKVISLIGPDREYFLKGRRAENQGLGIGAFAYYRRVIENQKNRILEEIMRVSERIGASQEVIADLQTAISESQFSKAVASIKHGIPQVLLINGHNPLTLLHSALSEGLHAQSDAQCLELATSIRVVLTDLAEHLSQALKDEAELNTAVKRLLQASSPKQPESKK